MLDWIVDLLDALMHMVWLVGKLIIIIIISIWPLLMFAVSMLVALIPMLDEAATWILVNYAQFSSAMSNAGNQLTTLANTGWPAAFGASTAYVNQYLPIAAMLQMVAVLFAQWVFATTFRIVKALIPGIS